MKKNESARKVYEAPKVRVLGSVVELTLGDTGVNGDGLLSGAKTSTSRP